uniref:Uncharacterized protein n=1 Tax=Oreochromis aureus TaxID=47969 RepID=A0AAZ1XQ34_OREAU
VSLSLSFPLILPGPTLPLTFTCVLYTVSHLAASHSFWLYLSHSAQGGHVSGIICLQWNIMMGMRIVKLPAGAGQVYGCDSPWTGGLILLSLLLCLPAICFHATFGLCCWDIHTRLWGCNSALSSSAIGGVFFWFCCLVKLINFSAHIHTDDSSNLKSDLALPACTWPFCLSTLISLLISAEIPPICRLPLSVVFYPEVNRCYQRQLKASKKAQHSQQKSGQEEAPLKEREGPSAYLAAEKKNLSLTFTFVNIYNVGMER